MAFVSRDSYGGTLALQHTEDCFKLQNGAEKYLFFNPLRTDGLNDVIRTRQEVKM